MTVRYYARQCSVKAITNEIAKDFVQNYHKQGIVKKLTGLQSFGIYSPTNNLLGVALFSNPRTRGKQKEYTTELLRLAFLPNVRVVGGASKLIKFFICTVNPYNFFTYQSLGGEKTDVYRKSGMTLVSEEPIKKIIVANGLTAATAKNNYKDWFSIDQAVSRGPDALLGTTLGEVFNNSGHKKTNLEIFVEDLNYHFEDVPGDRVFAWNNPEWTFYTYKITSTKDSNYYIGRRAIPKGSVSESECLHDGYFGSGGLRFQQWFTSLASNEVKKEILGIYPTWKEVVKAEEKALGQKFLDDPKCKNSVAGGLAGGSSRTVFNIAFCKTHGETKFRGNKCCICTNLKSITLQMCSIHGVTTHQGNKCSKCLSNKNVTLRLCPTHGKTKHQGTKCSTCNSVNNVSDQSCAIHGITKFQGKHCMKCNAQKQLITNLCQEHGVTLHKGNTCTLCTAQKAITLKECLIHGITKHQGVTCNSCNAEKTVKLLECAKHGLVKHQGLICNTCNAEKSVTLKNCNIHGLVKFQGTKCTHCVQGGLVKIKECPTHGSTKFRGNSCYKCSAANRGSKK